MSVPRLTAWPRTATVREDWLAWLPPGKEQVFEATHEELEVANVILGVIVNDAYTLCRQGKLRAAREQAIVFGGLFERLSDRQRDVLRALEEHSRRFRTGANIAPLRPDFFRSDAAQRVARGHALMSLAIFRARTRFRHKIAAIAKVIAELRREALEIGEQIAQGNAVRLPRRWGQLEVLHYDLNTCLRETTIVMKSFFCVLPEEELAPFRKRLFSLVPAIALRVHRPAQVVGKIVPVQRQVASRNPAVNAAKAAAKSKATRTRPSLTDGDNSRSGECIPPSRMRPDGTGGPNETN